GATWPCVGAGGGTCTAAGAGNINDVVNLPSGGSVTYTVSGTISNAFVGTLSNTATVTASGGGTDTNTGNNSAQDDTSVVSAASLVANKAVSGQFQPGGAITYTVVIFNNSSAAQLDNPGDEFTDVLPADLTLVSASATSGTATTAGNTVMWNGSVPGLSSVTITIDATINNTVVAGTTITNQGMVHYDADGNGTNETTGSTDDPATTEEGDPTSIVVIQSALGIPTLSSWGLGLMALLLAAFAAMTLARRRRA
nr:IPTL-CTERM sorting domain-containing protein [Thermoanaerobaculia bacterium]